MPTNIKANFLSLYRTFGEMYDQKDFIQTLERLKTGQAENMDQSNSSNVLDGINRPLARLSFNSDSVLDQILAMKTSVVECLDTTYISYNGTNVSSSAQINLRVNVAVGADISGATSGKIEYTIAPFSQNLNTNPWVFAYIDLDASTAATAMTLTLASDAGMAIAIEGGRGRVFPLFYKNSAGNVVFIPHSEIIHNGYNYYPSLRHNRYYSKSSITQSQPYIVASGTGNVSWIKDGGVSGRYALTLPNITITGPGISQTVSTATYQNSSADEVQDGFGFLINTATGSVTIASLNGQAFQNTEDQHFLLAYRSGNDIYFWNGLRLIGTSSAGTGTTVALFSSPTSSIVDDGTSFYLNLASDSNANFTADRTLTFNLKDDDRSITLGNNAIFDITVFSMEGHTFTTDPNSVFNLGGVSEISLTGGSSCNINMVDASIDMAVSSTIDLDDNSSLNIAGSSAVDIDAGVTISHTLSNTAAFSNTGTFTNAGTVNIGAHFFTVNGACTVDQHLNKESGPQFEDLILTPVTGTTGHGDLDIFTIHDSTGGPELHFHKARGTKGSETGVNNGNYLLDLRGKGYNGNQSDYETGSAIISLVDTTYNSGNVGQQNNDMPAYLAFYTAPGGGTSMQERMRIQSDGKVGIGTSANTRGSLEINSTTYPLVLSNGTNPNIRFEVDGTTEHLNITSHHFGPGANTGRVKANGIDVTEQVLHGLFYLTPSAGLVNSFFENYPSTGTGDGVVLPLVPHETSVVSVGGTFVGTGASLSANLGIDAIGRLKYLYFADRSVVITRIEIMVSLAIGQYDVSGELEDAEGDNPPAFNGVSGSYSGTPDDVKCRLQILKVAVNDSYKQSNTKGAQDTNATNYFHDPSTRFTIIDGGSHRFANNIVIDGSNVHGFGASAGAGSIAWSNSGIVRTFTPNVKIDAGEGFVLRLTGPTVAGGLNFGHGSVENNGFFTGSGSGAVGNFPCSVRVYVSHQA